VDRPQPQASTAQRNINEAYIPIIFVRRNARRTFALLLRSTTHRQAYEDRIRTAGVHRVASRLLCPRHLNENGGGLVQVAIVRRPRKTKTAAALPYPLRSSDPERKRGHDGTFTTVSRL
jgi:hypothetical protein